MPLVIENGAGIEGANSYASVPDLQAFAEYRLDLSGYTPGQLEGALVRASFDFIDGRHDFAPKLISSQGLKFPTEREGLPSDIKLAAIKAALLHLEGNLFVDLNTVSTTGEVESYTKKMETFELTEKFRSGTSSSMTTERPTPLDISKLIEPYIYGGPAGTIAGLGAWRTV